VRAACVRVPGQTLTRVARRCREKGSSQNATLAAGKWNRQVRAHLSPDDPDSSSA